ncbi:MAG: hypothetical protein WCW77_00555 [Patescibacteria group bacterium]|jgi:hypothetical protein
MSKEQEKLEFTSAEIALIKYIRDLKFGKFTVQVANSRPIAIEHSVRKIRFTTE